MAPEVSEVERALLALAPQDRAAVIHSGLLSLDEDGGIRVDQAEIDAIEGPVGVPGSADNADSTVSQYSAAAGHNWP